MKKSVLVVGAGRFGAGLIERLYELGHDIFAIDSNEEALDDVRHMILSGAIIDVAENDEQLTQLIEKKSFDVAVVGITQNFEGALMACHILKEAGIPVYAKALNTRRGNILMHIGAEQVIFPERDSGRRLANMIDNSAAIDILELPAGYVVEQIIVGSGFDGKSIKEIDISNRLGLTILLIYHHGAAFTPKASTRLAQGQSMILFGKKENIKIFDKDNQKPVRY